MSVSLGGDDHCLTTHAQPFITHSIFLLGAFISQIPHARSGSLQVSKHYPLHSGTNEERGNHGILQRGGPSIDACVLRGWHHHESVRRNCQSGECTRVIVVFCNWVADQHGTYIS